MGKFLEYDRIVMGRYMMMMMIFRQIYRLEGHEGQRVIRVKGSGSGPGPGPDLHLYNL